MKGLKQKYIFNFKRPEFWVVTAVVVAAAALGVAANLKVEKKLLSANMTMNSIVYKNTQYGFGFSLPASWKGYTIVTGQWEGLDIQSGKTVEAGPIIYIRHPLWTSQNPRQDIPITIFTIKQWSSLQGGEFHIGAAPIGPTELGRNSKYVFALPARYNFAFLPGYEEVEKIIAGHPLQPFENNK